MHINQAVALAAEFGMSHCLYLSLTCLLPCLLCHLREVFLLLKDPKTFYHHICRVYYGKCSGQVESWWSFLDRRIYEWPKASSNSLKIWRRSEIQEGACTPRNLWNRRHIAPPTGMTTGNTLPRYLSNPSIGPSNPQFAHRLSIAVANGGLPPDASPSAFQTRPQPHPKSSSGPLQPNRNPSPPPLLNHSFERHP